MQRSFRSLSLSKGLWMLYDDKGQNYLQNNHGISIGEDPVTESLEYYLSPEVLAGFGLKPIPYKEIGPEGSRLF